MNLKTGTRTILLPACSYLLMILLSFTSCKKEKENIPCNNFDIIYSATASDSCIEKGTITVQSPTGQGYKYKTRNTAFQESPFIQSLLPGEHILTVKTPDGCLDSTAVTIAATVAGPLFIAAKNVFTAYCFPCHTGSNPQAGHDWSRNCDILHQWSRIKARAVDGNPAPMPPSGLIPPAEREKILNWVNAGHQLED